MEQRLREILKKYWGYDDFRPMQLRIIESVLSGRDTLALMPTGAGKSLTYQIPALASDGLCIVVTPLIALMKDQVDKLRRRGIRAVAVHSGMSAHQIDIQLDNCVYGDVKLLYLSPERIATDIFRLRAANMNVSLLAVDEAHCISQWGYDFRPSYLRIAELRERIPGVPVLALTASATRMVADDIMDRLGFAEPNIIRSSFARKGLSYSVRKVDDKNEQLMRIVRNVEGSGIVYVRMRENAEKVAEFLRGEGVSACYYHGGLPYAERSIRQEEWLAGKTRVIVATNAFGMGIDKPDVRFVVHYSMCDSLESYYQEAGRAGRDGRRSYAVLLEAPDDAARIRRRFESEFPKIDTVKSIYEKICSSLGVAIGDGFQVSFVFNIYEFCAAEHLYIGTVTNALKLLQQNGYMTLTDRMDNPARLMFCVSRDDLYKVRTGNERTENILRSILRLYNGIFSEFRAIDEGEIAAASGHTEQEVHDFLRMLWRIHVIRYVPANSSPMICFDEERLPTKDIYIAPETYSRRKELMRERFDNMLAYAGNTEECRSTVLRRYFGDEESEPCGICDICLSKRHRSEGTAGLESRICLLAGEGGLSVKEMVSRIGGNPDDAVAAIRRLLANGSIRMSDDGTVSVAEK